MKLGIMQPYYFPYIGYWQLMNAVDTYVIYDDVTFIKGGWINRNRILVNGKDNYFNIPLVKASSYSLINEIKIDYSKGFPQKELKTLSMAYKKAPFFEDTYKLISEILNFKCDSLSEFLINQIKTIALYLEMDTKFIVSSELKKNNDLKGKDKVISICRMLNSSEYYNAIGGKLLYDKEEFMNNGIDLKFLKTNMISYKQFNNTFIPNLSIIDYLMFIPRNELIKKMKDYKL